MANHKQLIVRLLFLTCLFFVFSCKQKAGGKQVGDTSVKVDNKNRVETNISENEDTLDYSGQLTSKISFSDSEKLETIEINPEITEKEKLKKIHLAEVTPKLDIYAFKEGYSFLNISEEYYPLEFNYTYDTDFESAIKAISLFKTKSGKELFLALPSYTEEFATYHIISIAGENITDSGIHTFSMNEFEKLNKGMELGKLVLFKKDSKILLTYDDGVRIDFDVVDSNDGVNSKPIDENDKNSILQF